MHTYCIYLARTITIRPCIPYLLYTYTYIHTATQGPWIPSARNENDDLFLAFAGGVYAPQPLWQQHCDQGEVDALHLTARVKVVVFESQQSGEIAHAEAQRVQAVFYNNWRNLIQLESHRNTVRTKAL